MKNHSIVFELILATLLVLPVLAFSQAPNPLIRLEEQFEFEKLERYLELVERQGSDHVPARYLRALLEKDGPQALTIYQDVVSRDSLGIYADRALWRIAQYYFIRGEYREVGAALSDLIRRYPNSEFIPKAQDQMSRLSQSGAVQKTPASTPVPTRAPAKISPPATEPTRGNFTIQAGAFSSADNADFMKKYLLDQGFADTYVSKRQIAGKTLYMVWVGSYISRDEADRQKDLLSTKIQNIQFFVKPLP